MFRSLTRSAVLQNRQGIFDPDQCERGKRKIVAPLQRVFLAQLVHRSSTGALVVFGPPRATAGQEVFWYAVYGTALWLVMAVVILAAGKRLRR